MTNILSSSQLVVHPDLRRALITLESAPRFERRRQLRNQRYPRFFYKYRSLGNAEQYGQLRDYLVDSKLWLSSPLSFNDPFDMTGHVVFDGSPQDKRKRILRLLKHQVPELTKTQKDHKASEILSSPEKLIDYLRSAYLNGTRKIGVFSLTTDPKNILMWSHYASNHEGVCLQFDVAMDMAIFTRAQFVTYSENYPIVNWASHANEHLAIEQLIEMVLCKYESWRYEREHRIIEPDLAGNYLSFSPQALKGVILGCQMASSEERKVWELLEERSRRGLPAVTVYKANRHPEKFKLCISKSQRGLA